MRSRYSGQATFFAIAVAITARPAIARRKRSPPTPEPSLRYHLGTAYLTSSNWVGAKRELEDATRLAASDDAGTEEAGEAHATLADG
jgi:uncharacterized protein HemY